MALSWARRRSSELCCLLMGVCLFLTVLQSDVLPGRKAFCPTFDVPVDSDLSSDDKSSAAPATLVGALDDAWRIRRNRMFTHVRETQTSPKFFMSVANPEIDFVSRVIMKSGNWEPEITAIFREVLKECSLSRLVVDVGANIGFFSSYAAQCGCSVRSFEPQARHAERIRANRELNGWSITQLRVEQVAVGAERAVVKFLPHSGGGHDGTSWLGAHITYGDNEDSANDSAIKTELPEYVAQVALDELVGTTREITLLKIDIDGHELSALRGAQATIANSKNIILEIAPGLWSRSKKTAEEGKVILRNVFLETDRFRFYLIASPAWNRYPSTMKDVWKSVDSPLPIKEIPPEHLDTLVDAALSKQLAPNLWLVAK